MKKGKNKQQSQSNPTLTELLEPYLRNPPSPPPSSPPQSPGPHSQQPESLPLASFHTVQRDTAKPWRQFHTPSSQFYHVHPWEFCALVQRLTGASTTSNENSPLSLDESQVEDNQNATGIEEESMLPDISTSYLDWSAPPISSPRTMGSTGNFSPDKDSGESSDMGSCKRI